MLEFPLDWCNDCQSQLNSRQRRYYTWFLKRQLNHDDVVQAILEFCVDGLVEENAIVEVTYYTGYPWTIGFVKEIHEADAVVYMLNWSSEMGTKQKPLM
jgi:hypothetical protein